MNRLMEAHKYSFNNRKKLLERDQKCGCFYCLKIYSSALIKEWIFDTAVCPYCEVDSVLGEYAGYSVSKEFLGEMRQHWFKEIEILEQKKQSRSK